MEAVLSAVFILLGWALGLLSPRIVEIIQRPYRRDELRRSLFLELEGLRITLAAYLFIHAHNNGTINNKLLQVIEPILRTDKFFPEVGDVADAVKSLSGYTDEQLATLKTITKNKGALNLKKFQLPFLTSQLSSLYLFTPEFQRLALKICSRVSAINDEVERAMFSYQKAFDTSSPESHAVLVANLEQSHQSVAIICRPLIDDIAVSYL